MWGIKSLRAGHFLTETCCVLVLLWIQQSVDLKLTVQETGGLVPMCQAQNPPDLLRDKSHIPWFHWFCCISSYSRRTQTFKGKSGSVSDQSHWDEEISLKWYLECLRLRGLDRLNETFKVVCLNPVENTLVFLEDAQRLAMTQHLKTSSLLLRREMPISHSRETGPCGRAQMGTWVPWPAMSHSQRRRACH